MSVLRCAALIARATRYPDLDIDSVQRQVDLLAWEVEKQLPPGERYPLRMIRTVIDVLYKQKGFRGNIIDYYSEDNSFINAVLENKGGIPITLSLLFMEVAARIGLTMKAINLPGHLMIQPDIEDMELLIDCFTGEVLFLEDASERLSSIMSTEITIDPSVVRGREGMPPRRFLMRLLNNLKSIYISSQRIDSAMSVIRLMRATLPENLPDIRDEGLCLYALQRYEEAATSLQEYLSVNPTAEDAPMVQTVLEGCRTILKEQRQEQQQKQQ